MPGGPRAEGVDVSHHHPVDDWPKILGAGMTFFGAKATEGRSFVDPTFARHRDGARDQPFELVVYYHFARPGSADDQFDVLMKTVGELRPNERLALDVEPGQDGTTASITFVGYWLSAHARALPDRRPLIYTSSRVWRDNLGSPSFPEAIAADLWAPRYGSSEPALPVDGRGFPVWPAWRFWQDSEAFSCPGVDGPCDHSVFQGDAQDLRRYATIVG